jgi:imidazolonepropionase-like amidohydrolase
MGENTKRAKVLRAAKLIDGTGAAPKRDAAVLVNDSIISEIGHRDEVKVPPNSEVIDLGEQTILPGMVDAHMHFFGVPSDKVHLLATEREAYRVLKAAGEARKMLEAGITAARCLGSSVGPDLRRAINDGHVPGPRLMAAGEFVCSTHGTWDHINIPLDWAKSLNMLADGIEGVREIVRRRVRSGSNVIKVGLSKGGVDDKYHFWGDDPLKQVASYSVEEVKAAVAEAHLNKLKVSAHCIGDEAVRYALDSGVDTIEHGYGITEDTRKRLVDQNALVVSTICQLYYHREAFEPFHYPQWLREVFERHLTQMQIDFEKSLHAGVRYALGTDLIGYPTHPQDMGAREFEFAVNWGMDTMQAIVAGTRNSAEALGMSHLIGTIEKNKLADIIATPGDPSKDITELQRVSFVMLGGNVIINRGAEPLRRARQESREAALTA